MLHSFYNGCLHNFKIGFLCNNTQWYKTELNKTGVINQ